MRVCACVFVCVCARVTIAIAIAITIAITITITIAIHTSPSSVHSHIRYKVLGRYSVQRREAVVGDVEDQSSPPVWLLYVSPKCRRNSFVGSILNIKGDF